MYLAKGNHKLSKNVLIFSMLEGLTCPNKTAYCFKHCYAHKSTRQYPGARASRQKNYEESLLPDFVPNVIAAIKKSKKHLMRWMEAGDVYSQPFADKMIEVALALPDVVFLCYTRSFSIDFSKAPSNLKIYYSTDNTTTMLVPAGRPITYIAPDELSIMPGTFVCRAPKKFPKGYCGNQCKVCWYGIRPVTFVKH